MVGTELCLLLLAVDNQDGVGVHVAVLSGLAQVPVPLEQDRVTDFDVLENGRSVAVNGADEPGRVLVLQAPPISCQKLCRRV